VQLFQRKSRDVEQHLDPLVNERGRVALRRPDGALAKQRLEAGEVPIPGALLGQTGGTDPAQRQPQ
jgi:hypothetical protein